MPEDTQQTTSQPSQPDTPPLSYEVIEPAPSNTASSPNPTPQPILTPAVNQPKTMTEWQPSQPETISSVSQFDQMPEKKPSKWRYFFILLGFLQLIGVGIFFLVMMWAIQQAKAGMSGTEFIGLFLYITLVPAIGLIALVNLIGLPIYLRKHKTYGMGLILSILSLSVSIMLALFGAYNVYQLKVVAPKQIEQLSRQSEQRIEARQQQFAVDNAKPEITKEEAIALLNSCQLKGFYYTNQTSSKSDGNWAESSSTGVVLTKIDGKPYRISIADKLVPEIVPIARQAQKTCANPQFWHDGSYEQYNDGNWYFKGVVVNSTQSGKTRDEAISFMQNCKADYFVGYTDINLVKNANTKTWLDKAERSSTGIEISEGASTSYVFASKSMTAALQNTARQFRQSCYSTKKLYLTIDDTIETEYPLGKWTKVKQ